MNESVIPPTVTVVYACKEVINSWYDRLDGKHYDQILSTAESAYRHEILCINSNGLIDVVAGLETHKEMTDEEMIRQGKRKCQCGSEMRRVHYHPNQNVFPKTEWQTLNAQFYTNEFRDRVRAVVDVARQAASGTSANPPESVASKVNYMKLADVPTFVLRYVAKCFLDGATITLGKGSPEEWRVSMSQNFFVAIDLVSHGQIRHITMTRDELEAELRARGVADCAEQEPDRAVHVMRVDDLPSFILTQVAACFRAGAPRMIIGSGTLDEWRIERYVNFVTINRLCHGALYGAVVTRVDLDLELRTRELPTTGGTMDKDSIVDTLKTDAADAAWRTAGSQLVRLARDPLAALLARHLGPDDDALRGRVAAFLQTDIGTAVLSGLLAVAVSAVPGDASVVDRLARELRVRSLAGGSDLLAEVVMGPLRQVMSLYLQGVPEVAAAAAAAAPAIEPPAPTTRVADGSGIKVKVAK